MFFSKWHCQNIFHELIFHLFESVELLFRGFPTTRTTLKKNTRTTSNKTSQKHIHIRGTTWNAPPGNRGPLGRVGWSRCLGKCKSVTNSLDIWNVKQQNEMFWRKWLYLGGNFQLCVWSLALCKPMVNCWFGARWFGYLGSLYEKGFLLRGSPRIPKQPKPPINH